MDSNISIYLLLLCYSFKKLKKYLWIIWFFNQSTKGGSIWSNRTNQRNAFIELHFNSWTAQSLRKPGIIDSSIFANYVFIFANQYSSFYKIMKIRFQIIVWENFGNQYLNGQACFFLFIRKLTVTLRNFLSWCF